MSGHTKGPWFVNTAGGAKAGQPFQVTEFYVYAPSVQDDTAICADVIDPVSMLPSEANARLISAAPELLEALQYIYEDVIQGAIPNIDSEWWGKASAAIAKATGEQP